ncbi:MAG TPA: GDSL-type esterase/lipase family protein [Bacillota bacterium]|nr:GDSL-type esterase/lipase family protein [Bacillota bacterium]
MKKVVFFIVLLLPILYAVAFSEKIQFADISSHWAKSVIEKGVDEGIVKGYPDGSFRPDQSVTQSEFIALLIRIFPNAQKDSVDWSNTHASSQWTDSIENIIQQYHIPVGKTLTNPITRMEVAQIIASAEGYHYDNQGAIAYLYDQGLSQGRSSQTIEGFDGGGTLTRAEALAFIMNMKEKGLTNEMKKRPDQLSWCSSVGKYKDATLVALGDSITYGLNLEPKNSNPSSRAFPSLLAADEKYKVVNLGIPGWTTKDLLKALETEKFQSAINEARVVTLDIGSNDLIEGSAGILDQLKKDQTYKPSDQEVFNQMIVSEEKLYTDLPLIIKKIHQLTDSPIVIYTLYNPIPNSQGFEYIHQLNEQILYPINQLIRDLATEDQQLLLADAHHAFQGKEISFIRVLSEDIHPTIQGHKELARIGEQALHP